MNIASIVEHCLLTTAVFKHFNIFFKCRKLAKTLGKVCKIKKNNFFWGQNLILVNHCPTKLEAYCDAFHFLSTCQTKGSRFFSKVWNEFATLPVQESYRFDQMKFFIPRLAIFLAF